MENSELCWVKVMNSILISHWIIIQNSDGGIAFLEGESPQGTPNAVKTIWHHCLEKFKTGP